MGPNMPKYGLKKLPFLLLYCLTSSVLYYFNPHMSFSSCRKLGRININSHPSTEVVNTLFPITIGLWWFSSTFFYLVQATHSVPAGLCLCIHIHIINACSYQTHKTQTLSLHSFDVCSIHVCDSFLSFLSCLNSVVLFYSIFFVTLGQFCPLSIK